MKETLKMDYKDIIRLLPLLLIAMLIPLILRVAVLDKTATEQLIYPAGRFVDMFLYARVQCLLILVVIGILFVLAIGLTEGRWPMRLTELAPLALYLGAVIVATVLSEYKDVALRGQIDRFEGFYTQFAYIITASLPVLLIKKKEELKVLFRTVLFTSVVINLIAFFQSMGMDPFNSTIAKELIIPSTLNVNHSKPLFDRIMIVGTLNNPDFLNHYNGMILAALVVLKEENKNFKAIQYLMLIFTAAIMIVAGPIGGFLGFFVAINIYVLLKESGSKDDLIRIVTAAVIFIVGYHLLRINDSELLHVLIAGSVGTIIHYGVRNYIIKNRKVYLGIFITLTLVVTGAIGGYIFQTKGASKLNNIVLSQHQLEFQFKSGANLKFYVNEGKIKITNGHLVQDLVVGESLKLPNTGFGDVVVDYLKDGEVPYIHINPTRLYFIVSNDQFISVDTKKEAVNIQYPPKIGFVDNEAFGSGRGFIWSRSLPLILDKPLFGSGPDTYFVRFPQADLTGKVNMMQPYVIVDKPHNWFLQVAINTGIVALISVFWLYGLMFKHAAKEEDSLYITIFIMITAYYGGALVNDSIPSVASTFWLLVGLGLWMISSSRSENSNASLGLKKKTVSSQQ